MIPFQGGNKIPELYQDLMFPRPPMIRVGVEPELGTRNLHLVPILDDIVELLCSVFSKILHVFDKIPVIEAMLIPGIYMCIYFLVQCLLFLLLLILTYFSEFAENDSYFRRVHSYEKHIHKRIHETKSIFSFNTVGPVQYLQIYESYLYILCGEADKELKQFFEIEPLPFLKVTESLLLSRCLIKRPYL